VLDSFFDPGSRSMSGPSTVTQAPLPLTETRKP